MSSNYRNSTNLSVTTSTSRYLLSAAILLLSTSIASPPVLADQITWMVRDWAPYQYREDGEFRGYGIEMQRMIEQELPQYQHRILVANPARTLVEFRKGEKVCSLGVFKNFDREGYMHFGLPNELLLHLQLFMRRDSFEALGSPKIISLQSILENQSGVLAVTKGRSYDRDLDRILYRYRESAKIKVLSGTNQSAIPIRLLAKRDFDFFIEYIPEGNSAIRKLGVEDSILSVMLEETPEIGYGNIACAKTKWGEKVVKDINVALLRIRPTEEYRRSYEKYLTKDQVPLFREIYHNEFLTENQ